MPNRLQSDGIGRVWAGSDWTKNRTSEVCGKRRYRRTRTSV